MMRLLRSCRVFSFCTSRYSASSVYMMQGILEDERPGNVWTCQSKSFKRQKHRLSISKFSLLLPFYAASSSLCLQKHLLSCQRRKKSSQDLFCSACLRNYGLYLYLHISILLSLPGNEKQLLVLFFSFFHMNDVFFETQKKRLGTKPKTSQGYQRNKWIGVNLLWLLFLHSSFLGRLTTCNSRVLRRYEAENVRTFSKRMSLTTLISLTSKEKFPLDSWTLTNLSGKEDPNSVSGHTTSMTRNTFCKHDWTPQTVIQVVNGLQEAEGSFARNPTIGLFCLFDSTEGFLVL